MRARHLLTNDEIAIIKNYKGNKPFLPVVWALEEVKLVTAPKPDDDVAVKNKATAVNGAFRAEGFAFRGHCGQITNWLRNPVPFPYFSFLYMLLLIDLVLVSLGLVSLSFGNVLTVVSYVAVLAAFLGLKAVAIKMSDPFGEDEIDFNIEGMLTVAYENALACLTDRRKPIGNTANALYNPIADSSGYDGKIISTGLTRTAGRMEKIASKYGDEDCESIADDLITKPKPSRRNGASEELV